jgi:hypothetical protein
MTSGDLVVYAFLTLTQNWCQEMSVMKQGRLKNVGYAGKVKTMTKFSRKIIENVCSVYK